MENGLSDEQELEHGRRRALAAKHRFMWGLVVPSLLVLLVFEIYPVILAAWTSLHKVTIYDPGRPFVGLQNYIRLFTDSHFFNTVLPNTFIFTIAGLAVETVLGISVAMLLNRRFRSESIVTTLLLFPMMVAPSIAAILFAWMFNSQFGSNRFAGDFLAVGALDGDVCDRHLGCVAVDAVVYNFVAGRPKSAAAFPGGGCQD